MLDIVYELLKVIDQTRSPSRFAISPTSLPISSHEPIIPPDTPSYPQYDARIAAEQ